MKTKIFSIFVLCLLIIFMLPADALAKKKKKKKRKKRNKHRVALTVDPLYLMVPMALNLGYIVDVAAEYKLKRKVGLSAGGSFGNLSYGSASINPQTLYTQLRWYPTRHFRRGLQLGGQLLYANVEGNYTQESSELVSFLFQGLVQGFAIGPFVGYKHTQRKGFTISTQLGIQRFFGSASANAAANSAIGSVDSGDQSFKTRLFAPIFNVRTGWIF